MIKSKIDARERALELAIKFVNGTFENSERTLGCAKSFADFLIGDAELPETQSDTELVKAFLEIMNSEFEKKCKPNTPDYGEMLRAIQTGNAGISADTPCKSEAEYRMSDKVNWKQARVDASIAIAQGFASNNNIFGLCEDEIDEQEAKRRLAKVSVQIADALIAELKKTNETK